MYVKLRRELDNCKLFCSVPFLFLNKSYKSYKSHLILFDTETLLSETFYQALICPKVNIITQKHVGLPSWKYFLRVIGISDKRQSVLEYTNQVSKWSSVAVLY